MIYQFYLICLFTASAFCSPILQTGTSGVVPSNKKNERPNFLIIIADDAGWNDMSFHGSEINTPNLDKLAKQGTRLERFYVSPTCSPSRASLLTGMPASRMGIVAPISGRSEKTLPDSIVTLPQALRGGDYQTALIGKWHLGLNPASGPEAYGFDYSYGFLHGQIDQYSHNYKNGDPSWHRQGKFIEEEGHVTDLLTKEAIEWLDQRDQHQNFFLQLAYSAPHIPLQEPEEWTKKYDFIKNRSRRNYAAAMAHMDHAIGKVLDQLNKLDLRQNTIVLFISDNGAQENWYPTTQYNGKHGPNDELGSNKPLRDFKTSNYEGAIRVPAIISGSNFSKDEIDKNYLSIIDVMPGFLELAEIMIPKTVEGISMNSVLNVDAKEVDRPIYIRGHLQESIIKKPWKLIRTRHLNAPPQYELYNLEKDPNEHNDVLIKRSQVAADLKSLLSDFFKEDANTVNVKLK